MQTLLGFTFLSGFFAYMFALPGSPLIVWSHFLHYASCFCMFGVVLYLVDRCLAALPQTADTRGYLLAKLFYWLQDHGVTFQPTWETSKVTEDNFVTRVLNFYTPFFYHVMTEDTFRMQAYQDAATKEGARWKDKAITDRPVWIDIGCGQAFPLTQMVLTSGAGKHVHAIDGNDIAWPFIDQNLKKEATPGLTYHQLVTLHKCLSSEAQLPPNARADALIHELIGGIASNEGMLHILADAELRLLKPKARVIPSYIATHAVPVAAPTTSLRSRFANAFGDYHLTLPSKPDIYLLVGNVDAVRLSHKPQIVEEFRFGDEPGAKPCIEQMRQSNNVEWIVEEAGRFSGILMSCIFRGCPGGKVCDALATNTNWSKVFVRLAPGGEEVFVHHGDVIKVTFEVDAKGLVPKYALAAEVWHISTPVISYRTEWQGE